MNATTSNIDNLRFTFNGKVYGLHHSMADLTPGKDKILPTGAISAEQVTANDSTKGYTYFWDAADPKSLESSVHNQANARNIYLVEAASADDVLPDLNVPNSPARAIKGEMSILDKVSLPTDIGSGRDARMQVLEMLKRHGIAPETSARADAINSAYFMARGERALQEYDEARKLALAELKIERFNFRDPEKLPPAYRPGGFYHHHYQGYLDNGVQGIVDATNRDKGITPGLVELDKTPLAEHNKAIFENARARGALYGVDSRIGPHQVDVNVLQKYISDMAIEQASNKNSPSTLQALANLIGNIAAGNDSVSDPTGQQQKAGIKARLFSTRKRLAAQESAGTGFKQGFRKAMGSSELLEVAQDASRAVANRDSNAMRIAGAAATILKKRI